MNNRRNFYRLLHAQPDAPDALIKSNYRTLMQTLRMHPDLGGENAQATDLNQAYATLRKPVQRQLYDRELLRNIDIATLSQGPFHRAGYSPPPRTNSAAAAGHSRRNYYRILHLQADSPQAVIHAGYQRLVSEPGKSNALYKEAYEVIGDPQKRSAYDQSLAPVGRAQSSGTTSTRGAANASTVRCIFCGLSYAQGHFGDGCCSGCGSPIGVIAEQFTGQARRWLPRTAYARSAVFYSCWPGMKLKAHITDLSPAGLNFETLYPLMADQVIKIDSQQFKAVGKVAHVRRGLGKTRAGVQFLTVKFYSSTGVFVAAAV
jgi:curved DNA-binding protein CbpA